MKLKKIKYTISGLLMTMLLLTVMISCSGSGNDELVVNYTVNVTATDGGTVSTDKTTCVTAETVTVTATAESGFVFNGWYEEDNLHSTEAVYTFSMPARDLTLRAVFDAQSIPSTGNRYLVVYYTWSNNTKSVANELHSIVGGDLIEITPTTAYTTDYNTMLSVGQQELNAIDNSGIYPAINTNIETFEDYDVVFVGYPLWYSRMASPMQSFLHSHTSKLSGKHIALFCTSASSSMSGTVTDAQRLCPNANFLESLRIGSSSANSSHGILANWLDRIGVTIR